MCDPQVVWLDEDGEYVLTVTEQAAPGYPKPPAILMTPEYRAELRKLVDEWDRASGAGECVDVAGDMAAAIERMLEATDG